MTEQEARGSKGTFFLLPLLLSAIMEKQKRDEILRQSKVIEGATQRQIARVTGLGELVQLKLNIGTSVGGPTPTEAENGTKYSL